MTDTPIINGVQPPFLPIGGVDALRGNVTASVNACEPSPFQSILNKELRTVKFSAHAQERLRTRNIEFNDQELNKLESAVSRAGEKGSRDSLVLMNNNIALIVNVPNRTVITAMDSQSIRQHVFTNIDSTVIV